MEFHDKQVALETSVDPTASFNRYPERHLALRVAKRLDIIERTFRGDNSRSKSDPTYVELGFADGRVEPARDQAAYPFLKISD
jgi:hypothetical protein